MNTKEILGAFVRRATGSPTAVARPSQAEALADATAAVDAREHVLLKCPTGSGKSAIALSIAAHRAVNFGERTVLSTQSLSLQQQILTKDGPDLINAVADLGGPEVTIAVLKGVSNYLDPRRLIATAQTLTGADTDNLHKLIAEVTTTTTAPTGADLDGVDFDKLRALVLWGLNQYLDDDAFGDRHSYTASHTNAEWELVSASSAEASSVDDTVHIPKASLAKDRVAQADIVVTNHTMLALQAAKNIPVVIGNTNLGVFENIIVDEAHALPDEVRAQGAAEVSGRTITAFARQVTTLAEGDIVKKWASDGDFIADEIESRIRARLGRDKTVKVGNDDDPLDGLGTALTAWVRRATRMLEPALKSPVTNTELKAKRALGRAGELCATINSVTEHHGGEARWVEETSEVKGSKFRAWSKAQSSPVDVSGKIARELWERPDEFDPESTVPLAVICMSATLPDGFGMDVGSPVAVNSYASPFAAAYANSILYVPLIKTADGFAAVTSERYGPRKFDTALHAEWAIEAMCELVAANNRSALILSATAAAGKKYVDALRWGLPADISVFSQWDGSTPAALLDQWRADTNSVLVGTRSLMTGVDAPGQTCSLVILDRIPRRPSNPRDDARAEVIASRVGDKWVADRLVYAADAALLEAQSVGRLIRSASDSGMVAVLDPRLLKSPPNAQTRIAYPEATRQVYMKPLYEFPNRVTGLEEAVNWLEQYSLVHAVDQK